MLVMKVLLYNYSFTVAIFCSKQHIFVSNTATKKVPEDQEFSYYSAVLHQRMEGESPVTAAGSAR